MWVYLVAHYNVVDSGSSDSLQSVVSKLKSDCGKFKFIPSVPTVPPHRRLISFEFDLILVFVAVRSKALRDVLPLSSR